MSGNHCSCRKLPAWVKRRGYSWSSAQFRSWDPAPPQNLCTACWQGLLFRLSSHQLHRVTRPEQLHPGGAKLIGVSKHPPPAKERKAPAQASPGSWDIALHSVVLDSVCSSLPPAFDFCLSPSVKPMTVFRWLFVYTSHVTHHNLCLSRSIKAALAKGQLRFINTLQLPTSSPDAGTPSREPSKPRAVG